MSHANDKQLMRCIIDEGVQNRDIVAHIVYVAQKQQKLNDMCIKNNLCVWEIIIKIVQKKKVKLLFETGQQHTAITR